MTATPEKSEFKLHVISNQNEKTETGTRYEAWSEFDIGVLADAEVDDAGRLRAIFSKYNVATTLLVVTDQHEEPCGVMRLVGPSEKVNNPTLDYFGEEEWQLDEGDVQARLLKAGRGHVDFSSAVDILSFSIKPELRKSSFETLDGYFSHAQGVNIILFQAMYNWCGKNNIQWVTAMYAAKRAGPILASGLMEQFPGVEQKKIGGTDTIPLLGRFAHWKAIVEASETIRSGVFGVQYPPDEIDKVAA